MEEKDFEQYKGPLQNPPEAFRLLLEALEGIRLPVPVAKRFKYVACAATVRLSH